MEGSKEGNKQARKEGSKQGSTERREEVKKRLGKKHKISLSAPRYTEWLFWVIVLVIIKD
jgi:hypothetical protein